MEMTNEPKSKKEWTQPELLVMARSNPEEAVLGNCKNSSGAALPGGVNSGCDSVGEISCNACFFIVAS